MKKIKLLYILTILIFCACTDDREEFHAGVDMEEQMVEMMFSSPSLTYSTTLEDDKEVLKLDLVVCKDGIYQYTRPAYTSDYATFRSTLKIDDQVDIYFFANTNVISENVDLLQEGTSWEDIRSKLFLTQPQTVVGNKTVLPMWGQLKGVNISEHKVNNFGQVRLLRSVASANVYFNLKKGMKFAPQVAYVYFGADRAFAAPEEDNLTFVNGLLNGVKQALSPAGMRTSVRIKADAKEDSIANILYMFDNSTSEYYSEQPGNRRTRLVVGGYLEDSKEMSYYPLDFFASGQSDLLQVTRNDQYNLTITAVNSEGYPDPDEAAENAAVNIDYEVILWDQHNDEHIGVDGQNYLSVSKKKVVLYPNRGAKETLDISGTFLKEQISFEFKDSSNGQAQRNEDVISNDRFSIEMKGEGTEFILIFTALGNYDSSNLQANKDILFINAGRLSFEIEIEQIHTRGWENGGNNQLDF